MPKDPRAPELEAPGHLTDPLLYVARIEPCPRCGGGHTTSVGKFHRQPPAFLIARDVDEAIGLTPDEQQPIAKLWRVRNVKRHAVAWWAVCPTTKEPIFATDQLVVTQAIR